MHFHIDNRVKYAVLTFAAAFAAVMLLFIFKPHIVRSRNKYVRTLIILAIAFVPGVLTASICARTVTMIFCRNTSGIASEEAVEEEREEEHEQNAFSG